MGDTEGVTARSGSRYPHAPIVEAVIEVRVEPNPGVQLSELRDARPDDDTYAISEDVFAIVGHVAIGPQEVSSGGTRQHVGFLYRSDDGKQLWQARLDGYLYSRLAPYDRWATFAAEALRLWDRYETVARPVAVRRLGVRYINRITFPPGPVKLEDYLRTYPEVARDLPQMVEGFFFNVRLPMDHLDAHVNLVETIITDSPSKDSAGMDTEPPQSVILDIDATRELSTPLAPPSRGWLEGELATLRTAKNEVFEASITETTRGMFL